jgi:glycogen phosphorylase
VERVLGDYFDINFLKTLAGEENLHMTRLALSLSEYVNGVAKRHAEVSNQLYPGYQVDAVTNGVHPFTWTCQSFSKLYDVHLPGWTQEPELLVHADRIPDAAIWRAHLEAKKALVEKVRALSGTELSADLPILGFARRMTAYKRPELLFSDLERLRGLAKVKPFQLILSGKAHPKDTEGKGLIEGLHSYIRELSDVLPIAYVPNYNMEIALAMVSGVDVWLNTPLRPKEASGTSGMKAAFNGVPHLSILDGWWIEGCIEGVTGWAIGNSPHDETGDDSNSLYQKLEQVVLPLYYEDRAGWLSVMKGAICKTAPLFNSHRMMHRYVTKAYMR